MSLYARVHHIETLMELGDFDEARNVFQEAANIADRLSLDDPTTKYWNEYWRARVRLAGAILSKRVGDYDTGEQLALSAISTFEKLYELVPEQPGLLTDLGSAYRHLSDALVLQKQLNEADTALGKAIRHGRAAGNTVSLFHVGVAQFRRAQLLAALGRNDKAAEATAAALDQFDETCNDLPDEAYCNHRLVILLTMSPLPEFRDPDRALGLAMKISAESGGLFWRCRAIAQYRSRDYPGAIKSAHEAMSRLEGGDSIDWMILAMALWQDGERIDAHRWLRKAIEGIENRDPVLFGAMGPLAIDQLREEAETLIADQ